MCAALLGVYVFSFGREFRIALLAEGFGISLGGVIVAALFDGITKRHEGQRWERVRGPLLGNLQQDIGYGLLRAIPRGVMTSLAQSRLEYIKERGLDAGAIEQYEAWLEVEAACLDGIGADQDDILNDAGVVALTRLYVTNLVPTLEPMLWNITRALERILQMSADPNLIASLTELEGAVNALKRALTSVSFNGKRLAALESRPQWMKEFTVSFTFDERPNLPTSALFEENEAREFLKSIEEQVSDPSQVVVHINLASDKTYEDVLGRGKEWTPLSAAYALHLIRVIAELHRSAAQALKTMGIEGGRTGFSQF